MKLPLLLSLLLAFPVLVRAAFPVFVEAENVAPAGAVRVSHESASEGAYITSEKLWHTLAVVEVPPAHPLETLSVWIRVRGLPIALKAPSDRAAGLKSRELGWVHRAPDDWGWRHVGTFTREQLGDRVSFMRGRGDVPGAGLDAILIGLAKDTKTLDKHMGKPVAAAPSTTDAGIENAPIDGSRSIVVASVPERSVEAVATIDWSRLEGPATRRQFSLNAYRGFTPEIVSHPDYAKGIAYMNPGFIRYHASGLTADSKIQPEKPRSAWLDHANRRWDEDKIRAALDAFSPEGVERMICISNFPTWMRTEGTRALDPAYYDDFARLCADLVRIVNIKQKRGIAYFEITNERDFVYWRPQMKAGEPVRVAELAKIYNLAADAMRAVDPSIKLGGPAACRGEPAVLEQHREFARLTLRNLDFFSFHCYPTGLAATSDADVYDGTEEMGYMIRDHVRMIAELSPSRHIEVHLNEYNINYRWREGDQRMRNHKAAVFDSLFFVEAVRHRLDVGAAWNECDGTYGKMDSQYRLRPAAHVFHFFNNWFVGRSVAATTSHPKSVVPFAVESDGRRSLALINRSGVANTVRLAFAGGDLPSGTITAARISEQGLDRREIDGAFLRNPIPLPPHSVTFYTFAP